MSIWLSRVDLQAVSHYASKILLVLIVLLLGWQLGSMLSFSLQSPVVLTSPSLQKNTVSNNALPRVVSIDLLGHQAVEPSAKDMQKQSDVTETQLNLKVWGIIALPDNKGLVIVQSGSETLLASVGENIQGGVVLEEVYSDYVVIDHNGVLEKLLMVEDNLLLESDAFGLKNSDAPVTDLEKVTKELKKSPMKIMQYVRFQLINAGKHDASMKLWPKKETEVFSALGLEPGDVLKMVNGRSIAQLMQKPTLWQEVLNESVLEMEIERQKQVEFLVIELN